MNTYISITYFVRVMLLSFLLLQLIIQFMFLNICFYLFEAFRELQDRSGHLSPEMTSCLLRNFLPQFLSKILNRLNSNLCNEWLNLGNSELSLNTPNILAGIPGLLLSLRLDSISYMYINECALAFCSSVPVSKILQHGQQRYTPCLTRAMYSKQCISWNFCITLFFPDGTSSNPSRSPVILAVHTQKNTSPNDKFKTACNCVIYSTLLLFIFIKNFNYFSSFHHFLLSQNSIQTRAFYSYSNLLIQG